MAKRMGTISRKDKKIFKRTATKSKKINLMPLIYRGGIRL